MRAVSWRQESGSPGFTFDHAVALAADGEGGIEHDGMARHQPVEEMPQGGEVLVARGDAGGFRELGKILPYMPRGDLRQLPPAVFLGPLEEALHRVQVRALRMLVADRAEEELLRREDSIGAGALNDRGQLFGNVRGRNPGRRGQCRGQGHQCVSNCGRRPVRILAVPVLRSRISGRAVSPM